ncbi:MAG: polyphosphate kinase 2 family protein [Planctomycetes bacterium]|nr:polyphosphate kinase 2 family protein [Planctomycetota bacterium]
MGNGTKSLVKQARELAARYRIDDGRKFQLESIDPDDTGPFSDDDKSKAQDALAAGVDVLSELQDKLYAQDQWSVLLIFQAMDAAGKDGAIKHVMSGVNPQGCQVFSFKAPSAEELDHDFLWRCQRNLPERGRIGIFNRSYYEETLVVRVHDELLHRQNLPETLVTKDIFTQRFADIRNFESYLARNGVLVRKFFLHVSKKEQKKRFLERLEDPEKHWKFSAQDVKERGHWNAYMDAYQDVVRQTSAPHAPWFVVPADNKWFTRTVVAAAVIDALDALDLSYPKIGASQRADLDRARETLMRE